MSIDTITNYFPGLSDIQRHRFEQLIPVYMEWNEKINVISRKDINNLVIHHILHSLAIARIIQFKQGTHVMDVGTGGGFPGIPLAIMFPETNFVLVDSIGKKIKVVNEISSFLKLKNVNALHARVEKLQGSYDFVVSRAVTALPIFVKWVNHLISEKNNNKLQNGIIYLKGGEYEVELKSTPLNYKVYHVSKYFEEGFFETKVAIHLFR